MFAPGTRSSGVAPDGVSRRAPAFGDAHDGSCGVERGEREAWARGIVRDISLGPGRESNCLKVPRIAGALRAAQHLLARRARASNPSVVCPQSARVCPTRALSLNAKSAPTPHQVLSTLAASAGPAGWSRASGVQFSTGSARAAAADDRNGGRPRPWPSHRRTRGHAAARDDGAPGARGGRRWAVRTARVAGGGGTGTHDALVEARARAGVAGDA